MKTILNFKTFFAVLFAAQFTMSSVYAKDKVISYSELPALVQTYIQQHFPQHQIQLITVDKEGLNKEYEIDMTDRTELKFIGNKIIELKSNSQLPNSTIPQTILRYVEKNYPKNQIVNWDLERNFQEIELDNGIELKFSLLGDFIKIK